MNDGGRAFPTTPEHHGWNGNEGCPCGPGMTLRDYYAAAALTGLLHIGAQPDASPRVLAEYAYKFADAMLDRRAAAAERGEQP
jgi:hypothetical protein